jgi:hypothetical protein
MGKFTFELNKSVIQGDDRVIKMIFDVSIDGWEVFYTAKKNFSKTDEEADITVNTADVLFSSTDATFIDTFEIPLTSEKTNIEPGDYLHDIKVIKTNGVVNTLAEGTLIIESHQTKRKS